MNTCATCRTRIEWIDCPTGGWWAHHLHPEDGHDAEPLMVTVETDALPAKLRKLAAAAVELGWASVWATRADLDDNTTILVRFARGDYRCYGFWKLTTTDGKGSLKWGAGCARHVPPGRFATLTALKAYLGIA